MKEFESLPGFVSNEATARALLEDGITAPTEAQSLAFEPILAGKNVVIDSATGTGKTLAYLLPLLQRLSNDTDRRVVCLAPATELAVQTLGVANRYKAEALKTGALLGGGNQKKQKDRVTKSTRLILGTPGRVLEMIAARKLKGVTTFVLDEPEPILNTKDGAFLLEVLSRPPRPQVVLAGATFGQSSAALIERLMGGEAHVAKSKDAPLLTKISHYRLRVRDAADRDLQLARYLEQEHADRAIVYVNQSHKIRHLYRYLQDSGVPTLSLSQDRSKEQCKDALRSFSKGDVQVLLTTDRAATGIDIDDVPTVIHYEMPHSTQAYVHRAGRTGRAGKSGRSLALINDQERFILRKLEEELGVSFKDIRIGKNHH